MTPQRTSRRVILMSAIAPLVQADEASQVRDLIAVMTGSLINCNPQGFLTAFDKGMPGYNRLSADVTALLREYEVESTVDVQKDEGDERKRSIEADWLMLLRQRLTLNCENPVPMPANVTREKILKFTLERSGRGKWKVTGFEPLDFFAPLPPA